MTHPQKQAAKYFLLSVITALAVIGYLQTNWYAAFPADQQAGAVVAYWAIWIGLIWLMAKFWRTSRIYAQGSRGESKTKLLLRGLPDEFKVFTNVVLDQKGDIDVIIIGPTGVWTIDVKSHRGVITFRDGRLLRDGRDFPKDILRQARGEMHGLKDALMQRTGRRVFVHPAIVFSDRDANVRVGSPQVEGVYVFGINDLERIVSHAEPRRLSEADINDLAAAIKTYTK